MSLTKQRDFKEFLQKELKTRSDKNQRYGLRAFSKFLELDSSRLSKILRGQRPISAQIVESCGAKLGLSEKQIAFYKKHLQASYKKQSLVSFESTDFYQVKMDQIALISEWQHYAILEIMKHPDFENSVEWISRHLHQPQEIIALAIERLKRIGILTIDSSGKWLDQSEGFSTHVLGDNLSSRAHRHYQSQILELSREALNYVPIELRDHSTIAVATNQMKIQEAKTRIKKFRRELAEFLEDTDTKNEVYHLNIGLFPIPERP